MEDAPVDVYVCRHGTTTWNLAKKWQGETDTELAEVGVEQARVTAEDLAARLPRVACIYASDLKRAHRTAKIYGERLGCEVVVERRLREPSLGKFEGMIKSDIYQKYGDLFSKLAALEREERLNATYFPGLESPRDTSSRAEAAAADAVEAARGDGGGAVLLVTHSKVIEALLAVVFGKFYDGVATKPCAFFHWRYRPGAHSLGELRHIECHTELVEQ